MNKKLIIEIRKGGLGDHLFYSHLPRIAKETGAFDSVYISNHSFFRNEDYKKLIWESNPFVDGFTEDRGVFHFSTFFSTFFPLFPPHLFFFLPLQKKFFFNFFSNLFPTLLWPKFNFFLLFSTFITDVVLRSFK